MSVGAYCSCSEPTADAEMIQQAVELVEEELDGPEVDALVLEMRGLAAAELVVMHHGAALVRDQLHAVGVIVGCARAAMQDDQGLLPRLEIAGDAIPGLVAAERREAFGRLWFSHDRPLFGILGEPSAAAEPPAS